MPKPLVKSGAEIDGYTIGECVHAGGMATLWTVTHPGIDVPLLMKIPRVSEGEDPAAIVSFEMEMMILPRLAGRRRAARYLLLGESFGAEEAMEFGLVSHVVPRGELDSAVVSKVEGAVGRQPVGFGVLIARPPAVRRQGNRRPRRSRFR